MGTCCFKPSQNSEDLLPGTKDKKNDTTPQVEHKNETPSPNTKRKGKNKRNQPAEPNPFNKPRKLERRLLFDQQR